MKRFASSKDIRVAVVGYGSSFNMGRQHLEEMARQGMVPTAVVDLSPEQLEIARKDFPGIETYTSLSEMLEKSKTHLVTLITPHNLHAEQAIACLEAGRHVVCEKPLAITTEECDAMIAAAEKHDVVLSTYHNRHWDGCILKAVEVVGAGRLGQVHRIEAQMGKYGYPGDWWRSCKSISGGILYDWGVHLLEYALQIIREDIVEVTGFFQEGFWADQTPWKEDTNEDDGFVLVRFSGGSRLSLHVSSIDCNQRPGHMEIWGDKGAYVMSHPSYSLIHPEGDKTLKESGPNPEGEGWRFYENIAEHLTKGTPLVITAEWARRPIHILDLARQSALSGKALPVVYR